MPASLAATSSSRTALNARPNRLFTRFATISSDSMAAPIAIQACHRSGGKYGPSAAGAGST